MTRVVIHDFGGYPFSIQLGRALAQRGHQVTYLHPAGFRSPRGGVDPRPGDEPRFAFDAVTLDEPSRQHALVGRYLQDRRYGALLGARISAIQPEVVLSANTPIPAHEDAVDATHRVGAVFVYWMQDLLSVGVGQILGRRLPVLGRLVASRLRTTERRLLLSSDAVVVIAPEFRPTIREWGVPDDRISVIENWAPLDEVQPMPRTNDWSEANRLPPGPRFLYAGTLGRKHDPSILIFLADGIPEATVIVVTDGPRSQWLRDRAAEHPNLRVLPRQPPERISEVLGSADVLVALLEADASSFSVPSKVQTYLAAGRAVLASIPGDNPAARSIIGASAGRVVEPHDREAFLTAARSLIANPEGLAAAGEAARRYASQQFEIQPIADKFEAIMERCVAASRALTPEASRAN